MLNKTTKMTYRYAHGHVTDVWGGDAMCASSATSVLAEVVTGFSWRPNVWLVAMAGNVNVGAGVARTS